jgi:hypothetical protein
MLLETSCTAEMYVGVEKQTKGLKVLIWACTIMFNEMGGEL